MKHENNLNKVFVSCLLSATFVLIFSGPAFAISDNSKRDSLNNTPGVSVLIPDLSPESRLYGFKEGLQTYIELKLQKAGIRVDDSAPEFLYVDIVSVKSETSKNHNYSVMVSLNQSIHLDEDLSINLNAQSWSARTVESVSGDQLDPSILNYVANNVDKFINAYLAARSKEPPTGNANPPGSGRVEIFAERK